MRIWRRFSGDYTTSTIARVYRGMETRCWDGTRTIGCRRCSSGKTGNAEFLNGFVNTHTPGGHDGNFFQGEHELTERLTACV